MKGKDKKGEAVKPSLKIDLFETYDTNVLELRTPPGAGDRLLSLAMHVGEAEKDAMLMPEDNGFVISEPGVVQPSTDYGILRCQTCTLHLSFESQITASATGTRVKVRLGSYNNQPMIIIR